jgi:hypothetical protein
MAAKFREEGYRVLPSLLSPSRAEALHRRALELAALGVARLTDPMVPNSPALYGHPEMDDLMRELCPVIEAEAQVQLYPTYSYLRIYKTGDYFDRHTDRAACELSVSLNLGRDAASAWPLWIEKDDVPRSIALEPGSAVLYLGCELPHWRHPFSGRQSVQVFLHYVDQNGPYAHCKFDRRTALGTPADTRDLALPAGAKIPKPVL